ncbi:MAG: hypothetical protein AB7E61_06260 [Acholeplasmataceae bacterium]
MLEVISTKIVKARKEHRCMLSHLRIHVGTQYEKQILKFDGEIYTFITSLKAKELAEKLEMYERVSNTGEGLHDDEYEEFLSDFIDEHCLDEDDSFLSSKTECVHDYFFGFDAGDDDGQRNFVLGNEFDDYAMNVNKNFQIGYSAGYLDGWNKMSKLPSEDIKDMKESLLSEEEE